MGFVSTQVYNFTDMRFPVYVIKQSIFVIAGLYVKAHYVVFSLKFMRRFPIVRSLIAKGF
jgi:hypothetical protein